MNQAPEPLKLDRRRQAIIDAAQQLFVDQGYEGTTLADIVALAGGSLATVYKLFGNKDCLLEAVLFENVESGEALIRDAASAGLSPIATLHRIAARMHEHFVDPTVIALVRIVIARSISDPEFARQFFERTAHRTRDAMEKLFKSWMESGLDLNGSPGFLAEMFMGLFVSDLQTQAISHGAAITQLPERLHQRTDFFIRAAGFDSDA